MKTTEFDLQKGCIRWFRYQYPDLLLFHIPNGGYRTPSEAARFKSAGVIAGVPDLFLAKDKVCTDGTFYGGLFIEMKSQKGYLTPQQQKIQMKLLKGGYQVAIARSFDEFMEIVNDYLK